MWTTAVQSGIMVFKEVGMADTAIITDPIYKKHTNGPGHPESPKRLEVIDKMLAAHPARDRFVAVTPRDAAFEELRWIHEEPYIRRIEETEGQDYTMLDPDTSAGSDSYPAAVRAAGGTMEAVESVLSGRFRSAFAFVRPPGHHAEARRAMGFCLFNNIAVGAMYGIHVHGLKRILILDWDVHHGNGTMHSFYGTSKVLYFSVHQWPHYPGTGLIQDAGVGDGLGFSVNVPFQGNQGDSEYMAAFQNLLEPIAVEYRPELILVSAGFDAHAYDHLSDMQVSSRGFGRMTACLMRIADECCDGKIALVLEGGYDLTALGESAGMVLSVLTGTETGDMRNGETAETTVGTPSSYAREVIEQVSFVQKRFWRSLDCGMSL